MVKSTQIARLDGEARSLRPPTPERMLTNSGLMLAASVDDEQVCNDSGLLQSMQPG